MRYAYRFASVLSVVAALALPAVPAGAFVPTSITFFGDSLTDAGNGDIILSTLPFGDITPTPPYAAGVVSDGPIWAQYFATSLGRPSDAAPSLPPFAARNFAIGTARTGQFGALGLSIGMLSQLTSYGSSALATDPTGLYAIFGGANDIFDAASLATAQLREDALVAAVDNLSTLAEGLYGLGARHFMLPNTFDVSASPAGQASNPQRLGELSGRFNELLAQELSELASTLPGSTFYGLALDVLQDNVLFDAQRGAPLFGLSNVAIPCFAAGAPDCSVSVFADDRHPTTVMHALIAEAAYDRVVLGADVTPVPEPKLAALFLAGLGLLTWAHRRRLRLLR